MKIFIAGLLVALSPALVHGQALYKCKNAQGTTAYQQVPCADGAQDAGRVSYQREADSPHWSQDSHDASQARARQEARANQLANQGDYAGPAPSARRPQRSQEAEERRRFEHLAGSREGRAQLRAENKLPPMPRAKTYTDQNGGTYTQPPGGPILDNRTGRPCRKEGNNLVCE